MGKLILGIDDAGRGPLIGPMILAGVLIDKEQEKKLKGKGIRDSKEVLQNERIVLEKIIEENSFAREAVSTSPEEIDNSLESGTNLNTLEAMKAGEIINRINKQKFRNEKIRVVVDCPSVNINAWRNTLIKYIKNPENLEVVCEHKADANHVAVGAASIMAKVRREGEVDKIKKQFGNIGSGYPSDPITKKFLEEKGRELRDSGIFRKTWGTWKKLFPGRKQATLGSF